MPPMKHQHRRRARSSFHPSPLFWDELPELWLTKSSLKEGNRRNKPLSSDQISVSSPSTFAPNFLRNCSTACVEEIEEIARCGGPDLSDIRDYPAPADFSQHSMDPTNANSEHRTTTSTEPKTGSTTVYDAHFEQHLIDHGVFLPFHTYLDGTQPSKPGNFDEIQQRLRAPRPSPALSEDILEKRYNEFVQLDNDSVDEQVVILDILPILKGKRKANSLTGGNHPFNNLAPLTDDSIPPAKPGLYHGARPNQLNPAIQEQLSDHIVPSKEAKRPVVPNFFVEAKGHLGSLDVAIRQACYDGAIGARAMHSIQQFSEKGESRYDNKAYTIMCTYHRGNLGIYATHPMKSKNNDRHTDYVMTRLRNIAVTDTTESYQQGLNAYRNARDLADEFRDGIIQQANERYAAGQVYTGISDGSEETT
ncbi:hypothetical protein ASPBRDRAFT_28148 [Aspergillus brasiliensis CBS 101740]|uniref:Uncharacterized protein n=1 Tax=Aspergillus brasiliensis (strain CBS 101740 / IMI 381727 / IBT 21946) TaxID=767769 RepID=A0A1L9UTW3_ASPBC|nr:hypothetical protein ASPBRDRAFT_28148 [Aspergillus brasiliensis CBS 101740]